MSNDVNVEKSMNEIINLIEFHRSNAYRKINEELVTMYWEIGKYLSDKISKEKWGDSIIANIARDISLKYSTVNYSVIK